MNAVPMQISVSELKTHPGKYVSLAQHEDILITKNGTPTAKLVTAKPDKVAAAMALFSIFPDGVDGDIDKAREERFG